MEKCILEAGQIIPVHKMQSQSFLTPGTCLKFIEFIVVITFWSKGARVRVHFEPRHLRQ